MGWETTMMCQACEAGDHLNCGMQVWCECDCAGYHDAGMPEFDPFEPYDRIMSCGHTPENCDCDPTPEQEERAAREEAWWDGEGDG